MPMTVIFDWEGSHYPICKMRIADVDPEYSTLVRVRPDQDAYLLMLARNMQRERFDLMLPHENGECRITFREHFPDGSDQVHVQCGEYHDDCRDSGA